MAFNVKCNKSCEGKSVLNMLKSFMLGDLEFVKFEDKWRDMVENYGLEDNT